MASCGTPNKLFFRGDVIGFSNTPVTSYQANRGLLMNIQHQSDPYDLMQDQDLKAMRSQIKATPRGDNTTSYYAMELAAKRVKWIRRKVAKNDPQTKYYIFLLTDGLDNASPQVAKNEKRILFNRTPEQYKKRVQRKLKQAMGLFHKNLFEVYPMLYEGDDIKDLKRNVSQDKYEEMLSLYMDCLRFSSQGRESAPELIHAEDFGEIAKKLNKKFHTASYTFRIPKSYCGKRIRMTFENDKKQVVTLEAELQKVLTSYYLTDIKLSNGATIANNIKIQADKSFEESQNDKINAYFVIDDFELNGNTYFPVPKKVKQEYEVSSGIWQINSEYREVVLSAIDTYFVVVIDGSKSLDGKSGTQKNFEKETKLATDIIDILSKKKK